MLKYDKIPDQVQFTNYNESEESTCIESITLLRLSCFKAYIVVPLLSCLTLFVLPLYMYWDTAIYVRMTMTLTTQLSDATHVLVNGKLGNKDVCQLQNKTVQMQRLCQSLYPFYMFEYRYIKFEYDVPSHCFNPITFQTDLPQDQIRSKYATKPLTEQERSLLRIRFGECLVNVPQKTITSILLDEVLDPFYIFQLCAIAAFIWEFYYIYSGCIFVLSGGSILMTVIETRQNNETIRRMARYKCLIQVQSEKGFHCVSSEELVPGDIVVVPEGMLLPCDMIQLSGSSIVNESILTGESIPVMKGSLPQLQQKYSVAECAKFTLFGGTSVIQTRPENGGLVLGLVTNTGFLTTKGSLVRDILYPREINFQFYRDGLKFVFIMALIAVVGFAILLPILLENGSSAKQIIDRAFNCIFIAVPPALPTAMSCGILFAIQRLKKSKIFCISPPRLNLAGHVTQFVFDKTGTLTEDGLSVQGYRCTELNSDQTKWLPFSNDFSQFLPKDPLWQDMTVRTSKPVLFIEGCASCTAITYVNGSLIGDPLDVQMFQATGWQLREPKPNKQSTGICKVFPTNKHYQSILIRRFDFTSALQRMSVICKNKVDNQFRVFVKGSPEKVQELSRPGTMPKDFDQILELYTKEGYRVIALAEKLIDQGSAHTITRDECECNLNFLGLLIMENKLKPETKRVISTLQECKIKTIMATGDNVLTAISVARQCAIIDTQKQVWLGELAEDKKSVSWKSTDPGAKINTERKLPWHWQDDRTEVALTGQAFNHIINLKDDYLINSVLAKAKVFARMGPDDKGSLVENLQKRLNEQIGMCGDGANDCGALKAADIGISLSEAEASIAAPFTSAVQNIECVVTLLREGRASMATSFQSFKFVELYALIQFFSVVLLIAVELNLTDRQFLYIDLVALVPLQILQARTGSSDYLSSDIPTATLFYTPVVLSVAGSAMIQLAFQMYFFFDVMKQPFYTEPVNTGKENFTAGYMISYQDTVLFIVSIFQYVVTVIAFSTSKPFRKQVWTNGSFFLGIICVTLCNFVFLFSPNPGVPPCTFDSGVEVCINHPGRNWLDNFFILEPFYKNNTSYYNYRYKLLVGIAINAVCTIFFEKVFIAWLTRRSDERGRDSKQHAFRELMQGLALK